MADESTHEALGAAATAASFVPVYGWIAAGVLSLVNAFLGSGPSKENMNEEDAFNTRVKLAQLRNSVGIADSFQPLGAWGSGANAPEFAAEVKAAINDPSWTPADYAGTAQADQIWQQQGQELAQEIQSGTVSATGTPGVAGLPATVGGISTTTLLLIGLGILVVTRA